MAQEDITVDVLVVGSGASGMATAVTAAWHGLEVLVAEKAPWFGGTTACSGGWLWIPGTRLATEQGIREPPEWTIDDFRRYWRDTHGPLAARVPNLRGGSQNVVVAREHVKGQPCAYEELPIDGIAELWCANPAAMETAFASPAGRAAASNATDFLAEITAFQVVEHRVV